MTGVNPYLKIQVETASPVEHVIMLYDKTILLLKEAEEAIKNGDVKTKVEAILKADKILRVLNSSLDMERGGEIAKNLREIYNFVINALVIVNSKNDLKMLSDIIEILSTLKEGWEGIKNKV
ncbi:flagellar export chaperone FliS [Phorcysia thermohydrogeniphila]|uniref:Flagellar protein FliS n=1 Tax=Phorcysia thermohydrogeniphila TaxID=936138 RepID=A0A4R1GHT7_9BACT|nr:flagellar export chaperone FliS [Phorcysia thermohydrogeniphila]TCK06643.1 flagellar protein FliS [Phorcysia thermohydrogeniphila]